MRVEGGRIVAATPAEGLVVTGNTLRVRLQPAWLKAPIASGRPGAVDMIVIHHTAGKLQGDLQTFLYRKQGLDPLSRRARMATCTSW